MILYRYPADISGLYAKEHWKNLSVSHGNNLLCGIEGDSFDIEVEFEPAESDALGKIHCNIRPKRCRFLPNHPMHVKSS